MHYPRAPAKEPPVPNDPDARPRRFATLALILATAAGLLATGLASCGSPGARDLTVTGYSPRQPIDDLEPIEIQFDQPVVSEVEVGGAASADAVTITPALRWTGHWRDRQTLVIQPSEALDAATRYQVVLAGTLGARTAGFSFAFVHKPLAIDGVWGAEVDALDPAGPIPLAFNQPVNAGAVAAGCALAGTGDGGAITLGTDSPSANEAVIKLRPGKPLTPGASYTLTCKDLTGIGGNAPLAQPYILSLTARPALAVSKTTPAGTDVAPDEAVIELTFTTAVDLDAVRRALSAKPVIAGLDQGWLDGSGKRYKVAVDLDTETTYQIAIAGLSDVHGQALASPHQFEFETGDARPRLSMETGIYALEAAATGYPVWSRNVASIDVSCAAIPKAKLVTLLTGEMNYDPWGGSDDGPVGWKQLGVSAVAKAITIPDAKNKWHLTDLDLGATCARSPGARGVYLAELSSKEIKPDPDRPYLTPNRRRVLANVTDLGVLLKVGPASGLVWVASLATGAPVAGAKVILYTPQGKQVAVDTTDADGLVRIPGAAIAKAQPSVDDAGAQTDEGELEEDWDSYRSQRLIVVVEKAGDLAVVDGNWANGIQIWNFGVPEERTGGASRIRGFIQSDRGLYRPGETVHFKGLAREIARGRSPKVPSARRVAVEVTDSRGQNVLTKDAALTPFGGFAFDLALTAEANVGDYYVKATLAGQTFRERFTVEEFRTAAFELSLDGKPGKPGERLTFGGTARYLFGAPVAAGKVEWSLRRRKHPVRFPGLDQYTFTDDGWSWWGWYGEQDDYGEFVADGEGTTSKTGAFTIATRDPDAQSRDYKGPLDYIVSVNVTDDSDQVIGKSKVVTAHRQGVYLGVHAQEWVQAVGMPFGVNLVAVDPDGKRVAQQATLRFIRQERHCSWTEVGHRSFQRCDEREAVALEKTVTIAATGSITERIYPKDPGDYLVKLETTDAAGVKVSAAQMIWVIGKGEAFWSGDEGARMTLIASKPKYQPGDKARLVAQANLVAPTALITIERDGILDAQVRKLSSASEGVELTIADSWGPNVFASVAMISGRQGPGDRKRPQFKMGVAELKVATDHKQLAVAIELEQATVQPGQPVAGVIRVTSGGAPVRAELSLSAADEGVLQLIGYKTPNPMDAFYASYGLGVDSGTNWNRLARLADPESGDPDEGGDYASSNSGKVRSKFVSSAFWAPTLVTDEQGQVRFHFTAPDNLTAFRLMAVAADVGDRFGSGELRLTVNKPLMARPALPRFLGSGDPTTVSLVVHNNTDRAGEATVTSAARGATIRGPRTLKVPAGGVARAQFAVVAADSANAKFEFGVTMNGERDAVELTVPIRRPRVIETVTVAAGKLDPGGQARTPVGVGPGVLPAESSLTITVDRTGMGDLEQSLRYLVEYPYGCLEQTLSRFVPLAKAKDLSTSLGLDGLSGTKMDTFIRAGVAKVARHQQGNGHFSLWPQSQPYPHLTTYALWGLLEAKKAGAVVPDETVARGSAALREWLTGAVKPDGDGATMAMAAYVLSQQKEGVPAAVLARLYDQRAGLPLWGQAFLARAMVASRGDRAQIDALVGLLRARLVKKGAGLVVADPSAYDDMHMGSADRSTAMVLSALLDVAPADPAVEQLATGLRAQRRGDGRWTSTQDNLWALVALSDYARTLSTGETTVTIAVAGKQLSKKLLRGSAVHVVRVPLDKLGAGAPALTIDATGGAHYAVRATTAKVDDGKAQSRGFVVTRALVGDDGQPVSAIKVGDVVTVEVTVKNDADRRWLAMVDPIPAGFEVVNPKLASGVDTTVRGPAGNSGGRWWEVDWVHHELRDDRVLWFADYMRAGDYVLRYKARATIAGTFAVPPARIEAMYAPEEMGRTASSTVTVAP